MDRNGWWANSDVIVVAQPERRRLVWVPRDIWCEPLGDRINAAFRLGGHEGLRDGLAHLGLEVAHIVCLLPDALAAAIEGLEVEVPVRRELAFWYPLAPQQPIEEGRRQVRFSPPAERLSGERIHQWIGARYAVEAPGSDLYRLSRQQILVRCLLRDGFDFARALALPEAVRMSSPGATAELAGVDEDCLMRTLGPTEAVTIDGKQVLRFEPG